MFQIQDKFVKNDNSWEANQLAIYSTGMVEELKHRIDCVTNPDSKSGVLTDRPHALPYHSREMDPVKDQYIAETML